MLYMVFGDFFGETCETLFFFDKIVRCCILFVCFVLVFSFFVVNNLYSIRVLSFQVGQ